MLPLVMFRIRQFSAANAVTFVVYGALGGALFLLPVELQLVSGYSPLDSGLALLPVTFIMLVFSAYSGQLASRIGPRLQMSVGPIVVGAGLVLLTRATDGANYATYVLPAVVVFGIGLAITVAPLTSTAMGAAPPEHAGAASAINNVVARAAGLIAVAVLPFAAGIAGTSALSPHEFAPGFRTAMVFAGIVSAAGGLVAAALIRNPPATQPNPPRAARRWHCALDSSSLEPGLARPITTPLDSSFIGRLRSRRRTSADPLVRAED
jgi:MFS family permease